MSQTPKGLQSSGFGGDPSRGLKNLAADLKANRRMTTLAIMAVLQRQIVEELSTPGTGRPRRARLTTSKGKRKSGRARERAIARAGQASAPGAPPAPDTGKLRGSIQIEYDESTRKGRCGTNDVRAAALNFGTTRAGKGHKTTIAPRPFMEPALKKASVAMTAAGARSLGLALRTRGR